jgi:hypothetical protein
MVHFGCPSEFPKHLEEVGNLFLTNAFAFVYDLPFKQLCTFVVCQEYADLATSTKLKSVFNQVYQDLLETNMVSF